MKICKISTEELDERLELDKRQDSRGFRMSFKTLEEASEGFYDLQNKIRNGLEAKLWENFDDGIDRSPYPVWKKPSNKFFFFNDDMFGSERLVLELSQEILGDKLLGVILSYLEQNSPSYCLTADVYESMERDSKFLGRFVVNLEEIAIEESLVATWSERVKLMEIEEMKS